jgi:hypothetical protein
MSPSETIDYVRNLDTEKYAAENNLSRLFVKGINTVYDPRYEWSTSSLAGGESYPPDYNDLARLHAIVTKRKLINVLELGSGKSTVVLADALCENKRRFQGNLHGIRRGSPFRLLSIESELVYFKEVQQELIRLNLASVVDLFFSEAIQTTLCGQICGQYVSIPSCCPDLIYVDGPMPISYKNAETEYMDLRHSEVTNITCDVIKIEPMLLPGTIVIIDGMTNNARFIRRNLKRNWLCFEDTNADYTICVLDERPLGHIHMRQLDFQNS